MIETSKGSEFESIIEKIYNEFAKNERINAIIERDVPMIGDDGASHEIDILYSFEFFGTNYRVAIECKNWKNPINVAELRNFCYKLEHIGNINGIFISAQSEFQSGAEIVSNFNGIKLVKYDELQRLIDGQNFEYLIPDYKTIGDPFWMCLNLNGKNSLEQNTLLENEIFLFESKYFAEQFHKQYFSAFQSNIKIVGVSQSHLKEIKYLKEQNKASVKLFNQFASDFNNKPYHFWELDVSDIEMYIR